MIISDLSYLEVVSETSSIVGGDCSVSVINGQAKSRGCEFVEKEIKRSSTGTFVSVTAGESSTSSPGGNRSDKAAMQAAVNSVIAELDDLFNNLF